MEGGREREEEEFGKTRILQGNLFFPMGLGRLPSPIGKNKFPCRILVFPNSSSALSLPPSFSGREREEAEFGRKEAGREAGREKKKSSEKQEFCRETCFS